MPTLDYLDFINIKFVKAGIGCGCLAGQIIQDRRELILNELFLRILSETIGMPNFRPMALSNVRSASQMATTYPSSPIVRLLQQPAKILSEFIGRRGREREALLLEGTGHVGFLDDLHELFV